MICGGLTIKQSIEDLCLPNDNYGWASAEYIVFGIIMRKLCYIGLVGDLAERFRQHNGILPIKEGSKQKKIGEYFSKNERLGYTIFVQPLVHRNKILYERFARQQNAPVEDLLSEQGWNNIKRVEVY